MDERMQRLIDESDIRAVLARFARGVDRSDWELVRSCYHPNATEDHGEFKGTALDFVEWARENVEQRGGWQRHLLGQQLIEVNGDSGWAETYCVSMWRGTVEGQGERDSTLHVRFVDTFERRDGEWRIAHRTVVYEPGRLDEVPHPYRTSPAHAVYANDRSDPSYRAPHYDETTTAVTSDRVGGA